ncbi:MAG: IS200/IS605 family transposase [Gracilimonas sp.]|uniref:IS200/IS605 family transposase n=1 Tax=Gracilimonas TaxID=649462 RepID=UPI001B2886AF|nr:IS200/IS605 family transposase [Gracilimonas sp.]MBO6587024.1 IS200/IS605 family transposase [Gracilimonas sp.]MBO6614488.1 IS200/IS605 family transposase [Gracilimonas sp.]
MPKTLNQVWVHAVWSTKDRLPLLKRYFRGELNIYIKENSLEWGIQVDVVNGMQDHLHVLFKLPTTLSVAEVIKQMKGSSSRWVNENYYPSGKFEWQQGYGVFSVSMNDINRIRNYIYNQELHHQNRSFQDEVKEFDIRKM